MNEQLRCYWLNKDASLCNNKNADYAKSVRIYQGEKNKLRAFNKSLFECTLQNGEKIQREWLLYSPSTGCVYCLVCKLFSKEKNKFSFNGFSDWKHAERIAEHERSKPHKVCETALFHKKKTNQLC